MYNLFFKIVCFIFSKNNVKISQKEVAFYERQTAHKERNGYHGSILGS